MMAVSKNGKQGFAGKVGNTVEYNLNGQWVRRSIGRSTKAPSVAQLDCRERMRLINNLLSPVKEYINIGFKIGPKSKTMNFHNLAYRYNRKNAIAGAYPNLYIDYQRVRFTAGNMPVVVGASVRKSDEGILFSWKVEEDSKLIRWNDQVMLMAYMPEEGDAIFQIGGSRRNEGQGILKIPNYHQTMILETYLSFISASRYHLSNSEYLGRIMW